MPIIKVNWIEPEITLRVSHGLESSLGTWREPATLGGAIEM